jgi:hypothetical protein
VDLLRAYAAVVKGGTYSFAKNDSVKALFLEFLI